SLMQQPALASRLDGTMRGELRGFSGLGDVPTALRQNRLVGESQIDLAPSEFRGQKLDGGSARLSLARGDLRLQGNLASPARPAGTLELAAHGRPVDRAPLYTVDHARFTNADLGAWLGAPSLSSRLSGVLTADAKQSAASPPAWGWSSRLQLEPSSFGA